MKSAITALFLYGALLIACAIAFALITIELNKRAERIENALNLYKRTPNPKSNLKQQLPEALHRRVRDNLVVLDDSKTVIKTGQNQAFKHLNNEINVLEAEINELTEKIYNETREMLLHNNLLRLVNDIHHEFINDERLLSNAWVKIIEEFEHLDNEISSTVVTKIPLNYDVIQDSLNDIEKKILYNFQNDTREQFLDLELFVNETKKFVNNSNALMKNERKLSNDLSENVEKIGRKLSQLLMNNGTTNFTEEIGLISVEIRNKTKEAKVLLRKSRVYAATIDNAEEKLDNLEILNTTETTNLIVNLSKAHVETYHTFLKYHSFDPPISMGLTTPPYTFGPLRDSTKQLVDPTHIKGVYYQVRLMSEFNSPIRISKGGWLTVMIRTSPFTLSFNRTYEEYVRGFGNAISPEYWVGLEKLYRYLQPKGTYYLAVRFDEIKGKRDYSNTSVIAFYRGVKLTDKASGYKLTVGDYVILNTERRQWKKVFNYGIHFEKGAKFSTYDFDHDSNNKKNCAKIFGGGWWMNNCSNKMIPTTDCSQYSDTFTNESVRHGYYNSWCEKGYFQSNGTEKITHTEMYVSVIKA